MIKSKPGNMTPGTDDQTLDGLDLSYLKNIQRKLKAGQFEFPPARRTQIPKPGKTETRPITIASPRHKIVQEAMKLVMEQEYEKMFLDTSHGFRPKRGTHTAIRYVDAKFQSVHYIIEADFSKAFDRIPHHKLISVLKKHIKCEKVLKLIQSSLKAGYIEFGKLHQNLDIGTPQGSTLSPLLCNIYLHELDKFMENLKEKTDKGTRRKRNKEYESLSQKMKYWRKKGYDQTRPEEFQRMKVELLKIPSMRQDETYVRLHYVRYADDFIIGIEGRYQLAQRILQEVTKYVEEELELNLNPTKTGITKYSEIPVGFLGYTLVAPHLKGIEKPVEQIRTGQRIISRRKKIRIRIFMDLRKVLKRMEEKGYIRKRISHREHKTKVYRGKFQGNLINLDHADIIRRFNSIIRGIYNYYSFVDN